MRSLTRWEPFRGVSTLQDQINRVFEGLTTGAGNDSALSVKADLPDVDEKDLDVRVENNILSIHGERKFEKKVNEDNYLRVERAYGSFSRSFSLANTVNTDAIKAEYRNGVLTLTIPKREEAKPKQIKVNVNTMAAAASAK